METLTENVKFPRYYNSADFNVTADVTLTASVWNKLGYVTVPAQQVVAFGIGMTSQNGVDSREVVKLKIYGAGGEIKGKARFKIANANETINKVVMEDRSENLSGTAGVKMAETVVRAREDSKLIIEFMPDTACTFDYDNASNVWLIPVTVYQ